MSASVRDIWVYLAASPLTGLTLTLLACPVGRWIHQKCRGNALANPILIAVALIAGLLAMTKTDYATYFEGAQFVHFLLGPATVAPAVPLYRQFAHVRRSAVALLVALVAGSVTAAASAVGIASHGIGTARAFQLSETAGAFSGLAMGLNGLATALLIPLLYHLLF